MKAVLSYLSVLFLFISSCYSQENSVNIIPLWDKGMTLNYKVHKEIFNSNEDSTTKFYNYNIIIRLIDKEENAYQLSWHDKYNEILPPDLMPFKNVIANYFDVPIIYYTDKLGIFKRLEDIDKIRKTMQEVSEVIAKKYKPEQRELFIKIHNNVLTDNFINVKFSKYINIYHCLYGGYLVLNNPVRIESEIPLSIANMSVPVTVEIKLTEINRENGYYVVELNQIADKSKIGDTFKNALKKVLEGTGKSLPDSLDINGLNSYVKCRYEFSIKNNILKYCSFQQVFEFLDNSTTEYFEMKLNE